MSAGDVSGAHLIGRVQTGHAIAAITGDRIVTATLWVHDIPTPGEFAMYPDQARILAAALLEAADAADADTRPGPTP